MYTLHGQIVHGEGNGHTVGMPTANLSLSPEDVLPPFGVYAAKAELDGRWYLGVTNVGFRPTLGALETPTVETLLLDFSGDVYGKPMTLKLYEYLRPTTRMHSLEEVERQVEKDALRTRQIAREMDEASE
ncbi:MAG: riboflavin kinase [Clostridia bacterium]|nr:riboflavin kinase [Clostridia bacterium]